MSLILGGMQSSPTALPASPPAATTMHAIGAAALLPALVAVGGPGVLLLMWVSRPWPADLNGFPAFRSGTLGDLVLLPAALFALQLIVQGCSPAPSERKWAGLAGLAGAASGGWVQWTWWADPSSPTSWAFSAAHHFSSAGAWHGGFFVVVSSLMAALWTLCLVRVRHEKDPRAAVAVLSGWKITLFLSAILTFAGLVALDSSQTADTRATQSSLIGLLLGAACLIAPAIAMWGRRARPALRPAAIGVVAAIVGTDSLATWPPTYLQLIVFFFAIVGPSVISANRALVMRQYRR